ncbi:uncharacterized protein LOC131019716 [Salvia miltiorrhiza]|uniref:uncharacterized protein LOC131019716 n=1 Tax=Salvia miltiorrhiza TaxID=226208 RepID=UPI0025ACEEF9|nr:uncharacterized protein LOC131019716 [Salvia miltiorrhiza]
MPPLPLLHNFHRDPFRAAAIGISTDTITTAKFIQFQFSSPLNFRGKALIATAVSGRVNGDHPSTVAFSLMQDKSSLEGAASVMSLLESFSDSGSLLTISSTHLGELKNLKCRYSDRKI